jgi:hypothetical protein
MKRFCSILIIILSVFTAEAFSKSWNGITPGVSTRLEVKKILGKGPPWLGEVNRYELKRSTVYISYEVKKDNKYSDKDIVTEIHLSPDKKGLLSSYIKKLPNFHKEFVKIEVDDSISHVHGQAHYVNNKEGFEITVQRSVKTEQEFITTFVYFVPGSQRSYGEPWY